MYLQSKTAAACHLLCSSSLVFRELTSDGKAQVDITAGHSHQVGGTEDHRVSDVFNPRKRGRSSTSLLTSSSSSSSSISITLFMNSIHSQLTLGGNTQMSYCCSQPVAVWWQAAKDEAWWGVLPVSLKSWRFPRTRRHFSLWHHRWSPETSREERFSPFILCSVRSTTTAVRQRELLTTTAVRKWSILALL